MKNIAKKIFYYKFKKNRSILTLYNNVSIFLPFFFKTIGNKTHFYYIKDDYKDNQKLNLCYNLKKLYKKVMYNLYLGLHRKYKIIIYLIDKNKDGYKVIYNKNQLLLKIGKSHDIIYNINDNFQVIIGRKGKSIKLYNSNLQDLIYIALKIQQQRKPEPYKGKGILFKNIKILKKKIKKLRTIKNFKKKRKK